MPVMATNTGRGEALRRARERQVPKLSQRDVARLLEIKEETYRSYEYGRSQLPTNLAKILASEWEIDWRQLYDREERGRLAMAEGYDREVEPMGEIRVLGKAAAGKGGDHFEDEQRIPVPLKLVRPDWVGWEVEGDSMFPFLREADVAVFQTHPSPKVGYPNLVRTPDGKFRTKIAKIDGHSYILRSLNPAHPDEPAAVEWLGYLVGYYRVTGFREEIIVDPHGLRPD
jgi:phage repressor protein C with HTH and peptisase S24 domain